MKTLIYSSLFILFISVKGFSQVTEGHITYSIDMTTDNPDMQMAIGMMQGSSLDVYFKEKITRAEMKMGSMMNVITISDETSGNVVMLMTGMIGQNAIKTSSEELDKQTAEQPKVEISFVDESKLIHGYDCKKAIMTDEEGQESLFWYTEDIKVSKKGQKYMNEQIPGFPMQYEINNNGMKMMMTVTSLETTLDKKSSSLFDMTIPTGYKELTMEQLKTFGM